MREISLTRGHVALVSDEDYDSLSVHKWFAYEHRNTWYAARTIMIAPRKHRLLRMHRAVLGLQFGDGITPDHKDGNGLNNQRENLRLCSGTENIRNQGMRKYPKTSRFKGVTYYKPKRGGRKVWTAQISIKGRSRRIGRFHTQEEAALAYNKAALQHFGEFARLNSLGDVCSEE